MPTLLQRCVRNTCLPAIFFPIPKILMQTGRKSDFIDYDPIISVDIGFVDLSDWLPNPIKQKQMETRHRKTLKR